MEKKLLILFLLSVFLLSAEKSRSQDIEKARRTKNIPVSLLAIWGLEKDSNYYKRISAIHKLKTNLSQVEIESLSKFLHCKETEEPQLTNLELNALKNEIVITLIRQNPQMFQELSRDLREMYADTSYDEVWRNYCIQFLGRIYAELDDEEKKNVRATLFEAVKERKNSIGGTALIAISGLSGERGFDGAETAKIACNYLQDPNVALINKITALQTCAQLNYLPALDDARRIMKAGNTNVSLKMSAIAAVGLLGDSSDLAMLNNFSRNSDIRIQKSASRPIMNIKKTKK